MLLCKRYHNSSLASLSLGCAAPAICKPGLCLSCLAGVFSSLEKTPLPTSPSGRGSLHGCFLLREHCWNPLVVLYRFWGNMLIVSLLFSTKDHRIYGYIGTSSGLLILPVAKSSSETVASSLNFGNYHPEFLQQMSAFCLSSQSAWVVAQFWRVFISQRILSSFGQVLPLGWIYVLDQVGIWRLFYLHYVPWFKKNNP